MSRLQKAIEGDVERKLYDGAVTIVAVGGKVVFEHATGFADRSAAKPMRADSVFPIFSVSKAFNAVLVLQRVERGEVSLNTPVREIIPEFGSRGKQRVTIGQLLSHSGGLPASFPAVPADKIGDLDAVVAAVCDVGLEAAPGEEVSYSPIMAHAVLGQCVRRLDGGKRKLRDIAREELLEPLGMADTALGATKTLAGRAVMPRVSDESPGMFDAAGLVGLGLAILNPELDIEIPAGGFVSTGADVFRFAEAMRQGGAWNGKRVLSKPMVELATSNHTDTRPNDLWTYARELKGWPLFPANLGLGFFLRGEGLQPTYFGHLSTPGTYGAMGAGTTNFWVDPVRNMTMVCLTTGFLEEANSALRFQRLSDVAIAEFA
ncbi:MAG TPA: serine hydrolase domain-containing protein [Roseiarcus sp.]|nr:serine hydrolase domain-containing protein [Roseiarcus sp.]